MGAYALGGACALRLRQSPAEGERHLLQPGEPRQRSGFPPAALAHRAGVPPVVRVASPQGEATGVKQGEKEIFLAGINPARLP